MNKRYGLGVVALMMSFYWAAAGCEKQGGTSPPADSSKGKADVPAATTTSGGARTGNESTLPPGHPPIASMPAPEGAGSTAAVNGTTLKLSGISMEIPAGWKSETPGSGAMAPEAVFQLPGPHGDADACSVRVTYFPRMKGMDDQNIQRWIAQVHHADGSPSTRDDATVTVEEYGAVRVTAVDLSGALASGMSPTSPGPAEPNQRMIAAIVDHPQGPHFIKASGPVESMAQWDDAIHAFLRSVQVD